MTPPQTSAPIALSKEDINMQRYYDRLLQPADISSIQDFSPFGEWCEIATEMYTARVQSGVPGVRAFMNGLNKRDKPTYNRLVRLVSTRETEQEQIQTQVGILLSDVE